MHAETISLPVQKHEGQDRYVGQGKQGRVMSWREFISQVIGALAWPAGIVILGLVFRREIRGLLSAPLKRIKAGPVEFLFEKELEEAKRESRDALVTLEESMPTGPPLPKVFPESLREEMDRLADDRPREAILNAYERIETELKRIVERKLGPAAGHAVPGGSALLGLATHHELLTEKDLVALEGLLTLRNLAVHAQERELSPGKAKEFLDLADGILWVIRFRTAE